MGLENVPVLPVYQYSLSGLVEACCRNLRVCYGSLPFFFGGGGENHPDSKLKLGS